MHFCHAKGCRATIPPRMFMCRVHWFSLPKALRDEVWEHYVPGQENRKDPTPEYLDVAQRAIAAVAEKEGL